MSMPNWVPQSPMWFNLVSNTEQNHLKTINMNWTIEKTWVPKNWCFWTVELEKTPESPLDWKEIKPANPKGNQSWIFIGRTDAEVETPILWPSDARNWLIWKDFDAGKRLKMGEGDDRGWDGWMASWARWTWVWASSGSWSWTGKPIMLQSMGLVAKSWTQLSYWTELIFH